MDGTRIIVNAKAGTAMRYRPDALEDLLRQRVGPGPDIRIVEPDALGDELKKAVSDREVARVVIGGGDGSVSFAARLALEHDKALGVLPLGTMNLFARALGMPLDLEAAAAALADARELRVDVGDADGTVFLNHVSVGLHPRMIRVRDRMPRVGRLTKIANGVRAFFLVLSRPTARRLKVSGDFEPVTLHTALAVVTVNPIPHDTATLPIRPGQSYGKLGCYFARRRDAFGLLAIAARLAAGNWGEHPGLERRETTAITLGARRGLHISIDGETETRPPPVRCTIRPRALKVLAPADSGSEAV